MTGRSGSTPRDPRLDFFRGSAMFIIFIAHSQRNVLWDWIPARFGLSDAADMFVFLSGTAAAIAFGGSFLRHGMLIGTARILYRCWQLFLAHLGLFLAGAALAVAGTRWFGDTDYLAALQLGRFFADPQGALLGLVTLTYVPHNFDILPVYVAVLAMVPAAMLLARLHRALPLAASLALYAASWGFRLNLPAHADAQPVWFFDPFAWQLIFFTGFALRRGWLRVPAASPLLLAASLALIAVGLAISLHPVFERSAAIDAMRLWIFDHSDKTYLDPLRYLHFLALAYVAVFLLRGRERILLSAPLRPFVKCGQQALSVFLSGEVLATLSGMVYDHAGTGAAAQLLVNGVSFALLFAVAYAVAWFKSQPWKAPARPAEAERAGAAGLRLPAGLGIAS